MEKRIFKYPLITTDRQVIVTPKGSELLTVQIQKETPCLWALVNPTERDQEERHIEVFGTGLPIHYDMDVSRDYLGTYQLHDGSFVFHVFERLN